MKIYYSKYVGYGSLAFACALFIHLAFLSILGFEGFPKVSFVTLIQILLLSDCDLCNHCWDQKTDQSSDRL